MERSALGGTPGRLPRYPPDHNPTGSIPMPIIAWLLGVPLSLILVLWLLGIF